MPTPPRLNRSFTRLISVPQVLYPILEMMEKQFNLTLMKQQEQK